MRKIKNTYWLMKNRTMVVIYSLVLSLAYKYRTRINNDAKNIIVCLKDKQLRDKLLPYTDYRTNSYELPAPHGLWDDLNPNNDIHNTIVENLVCVWDLTHVISHIEDRQFKVNDMLKKKAEKAKFKKSLNKINRTRNEAYMIIKKFTNVRRK